MVTAVLNTTYRTLRKVVIAVVGFSVLIVGVIMIVTPGPAFIVIPAGLAVLAVEFAWARRLLKVARKHAKRLLLRRQQASKHNHH